MYNEIFYLHGESEPDGIPIIGQEEIEKKFFASRIRDLHAESAKLRVRQVTLLGFGVDHGLGAHSGNGDKWRTTVVAKVRLDYLKSQPITLVRLEGEDATELMAQLALAIAVRQRKI